MPPLKPATLAEKVATWTVEGAFLFEDFEGVSASTWGEIEIEDGNHLLSMEDTWVAKGVERWQDYSLDFKFKIMSGTFVVSVRWQQFGGEGQYFVIVNSEGVQIEKAPVGKQLGEVNLPLAPRQWYRMRVAVAGGTISVFVDGKQVLTVDDPDPVPWGKIGFMTDLGSSVRLDDVSVYGRYEETVPVWQQTRGPYGGQVTSLAMSPSHPSTLFVSTYDGGVHKSVDGDETWVPARMGLPMMRTHVVAVHPANPHIVYAGGSPGLWVSFDGGESWHRLKVAGTEFYEVYIQQMAMAPSNPDVIYIVSKEGEQYAGMFKTLDAGRSWVELPLSLPPDEVNSLAVHLENPQVVFIGTSEGFYKSTNGGKSWAPANRGLDDQWVSSIATVPGNPRALYLAAGGEVYRSDDEASSWHKVYQPGPEDAIWSVKVHPEYPNLIFAAGELLHKSIDGGGTWNPVSDERLVIGWGDYSILPHPDNPDVIYVGTLHRGVLVSQDGGRTWKERNLGIAGRGIGAIAVHPQNPNIVLAGTILYSGGQGIYISRDRGQTWEQANEGLPRIEGGYQAIYAIAIDPSNPDVIYAGVRDSGVYKSVDGARSWSSAREGLTGLNIAAIAIDPNNHQVVYAGATPRVDYFDPSRYGWDSVGVFKSLDGGQTWWRIDKGIDKPFITSIAINPQDTQVIYVSTNAGGVYRSDDGGSTWRPMNSGLFTLTIEQVALDPKNPQVVYAVANDIYGFIDDYLDPSMGIEDRAFLHFAPEEEYPMGGKLGGYGGLFKSVDGGESWTYIMHGAIEWVLVDPVHTNILYIGIHTPGVYKSVDGGLTWQDANRGVLYYDGTNIDHIYPFAAAIDATGSVLYLGGCGRGLLTSYLAETPQ